MGREATFTSVSMCTAPPISPATTIPSRAEGATQQPCVGIEACYFVPGSHVPQAQGAVVRRRRAPGAHLR